MEKTHLVKNETEKGKRGNNFRNIVTGQYSGLVEDVSAASKTKVRLMFVLNPPGLPLLAGLWAVGDPFG
ncbi:hypothetical protein OUZ56_033476 [Daphnia magna]|uniref:Uncharacterized protein n=1 Tax=Daphnia magna TaxID=35525 RepID=A0ABR0BAS2_9CRUS|nr:hypothetical protein OUZ56_033476 [Daphnia magna]